LGVVAKGKDIDEARNKAYAAVKNIKFENMTYRTDIGIKYREG
jgi:phosphoribosylamine--glycine ligase